VNPSVPRQKRGSQLGLPSRRLTFDRLAFPIAAGQLKGRTVLPEETTPITPEIRKRIEAVMRQDLAPYWDRLQENFRRTANLLLALSG
jgi:hypothetical protein